MKEIWFIRHGETELNRLNIIQGSGIDSVLNETGQKQALAFYSKYAREGFQLGIHSALQRSRQTILGFINDGLPTIGTPLINEINWGIHEGKESNPEMQERYDWLISQWSSGNLDARIPEGESANELKMRLSHFFDQLRKQEEEKILVCTHGRTMRAIVCLMKTNDVIRMEDVTHANTGLYKTHLHPEEGFRILLENDLSHLGE